MEKQSAEWAGRGGRSFTIGAADIDEGVGGARRALPQHGQHELAIEPARDILEPVQRGRVGESEIPKQSVRRAAIVADDAAEAALHHDESSAAAGCLASCRVQVAGAAVSADDDLMSRRRLMIGSSRATALDRMLSFASR
jgi:hypothetical protein